MSERKNERVGAKFVRKRIRFPDELCLCVFVCILFFLLSIPFPPSVLGRERERELMSERELRERKRELKEGKRDIDRERERAEF